MTTDAATSMTNGISANSAHIETNTDLLPAPTLREICADLHARVTAFLTATPSNDVTRSTQEQTKIALEVIEKALHEYNFDNISFSYNGGKDCLVLLILYLAVIHTHFASPTGRRKTPASIPSTNIHSAASDADFFPTSIPSVYAKPPDPFQAVTDFVDSSSRQYHLDLEHISTTPKPRKLDSKTNSHQQNHSANPHQSNCQYPSELTTKSNDSSSISTNPVPNDKKVTFRDAFEIYLNQHPEIKAIFVGTRRTDPHGAHLTHFDPTDGNWPKFMRIHPVIDWKLSEIWCFLRAPELREPDGTELEYCHLYDMGYTSLGGINDTIENPRLKYTDQHGHVRHKPAYELVEDMEERLGRE